MAGARGAFVAVVGPDGIGKTSVARALCHAYGGPTAYVHFRPSLTEPIAECPPDIPRQMEKTIPEHRNRWVGVLRLSRSWFLFWLSYWTRLRPIVNAGGLVVADRWAYGYIGQPETLGFFGPPALARLAVRTMPHPDLTVNLVAPLEVVRARKQELSPDQIASEMETYGQMAIGGEKLTLEATRPPDQLAATVLGLLGRGDDD